jgi:tetratricopeptide (TPR) repeat protein
VNRSYRRAFTVSVVPLLALAAPLATAQTAVVDDAALRAVPAEEWLVYGRDYSHTHYSPLDRIDTGNVNRLRLAWTYEHLRGLEEARALHEENLRAARAAGDRVMQAETVAVLGQYALEAGRVAEALPMLKEAYELHRGRPDFPERYHIAILVCRYARALALARRPGEAARLLACAPVLFEQLGVGVEWWVARINEETLELVRPELDEAAFEQASEEGRRLEADEAVELALGVLHA